MSAEQKVKRKKIMFLVSGKASGGETGDVRGNKEVKSSG